MTVRCDNKLGAAGTCNTILTQWIDGVGQVRYRCTRCEARAAGNCWNCGKPRSNHPILGVYCTSCAKAALQTAKKRGEASPERKRSRRRYDQRRNADPTLKEHRLAQKREWRKNNRDKVRAHKRRDYLREKAKALTVRAAA